jgi:hypothetical protein
MLQDRRAISFMAQAHCNIHTASSVRIQQIEGGYIFFLIWYGEFYKNRAAISIFI